MSASNAPTAEYLEHHQIEAPAVDDAHFRPAWRRVDRLERLLLAGLISRHEHQAALAFRGLYEAAAVGGLKAQSWDAIRGGKHCRRPAPAMTERQAAALARLRQIAKSLGSLYKLLEWLLVEEMTWSDIGRRLRVDRHTAKTWTLAAIAALAAL